jgi:hypothetical protein
MARPMRVGANDYGTVFKLTPPDKGQTQWSETVQQHHEDGVS